MNTQKKRGGRKEGRREWRNEGMKEWRKGKRRRKRQRRRAHCPYANALRDWFHTQSSSQVRFLKTRTQTCVHACGRYSIKQWKQADPLCSRFTSAQNNCGWPVLWSSNKACIGTVMTLCHLFLAKMFIYFVYYLHHTSSMSTEEQQIINFFSIFFFKMWKDLLSYRYQPWQAGNYP